MFVTAHIFPYIKFHILYILSFILMLWVYFMPANSKEKQHPDNLQFSRALQCCTFNLLNNGNYNKIVLGNEQIELEPKNVCIENLVQHFVSRIKGNLRYRQNATDYIEGVFTKFFSFIFAKTRHCSLTNSCFYFYLI